MKTPLVVLCPGQGSQTPGMGQAWAEASAEARATFELADRIAGDRLGTSLSNLCFEGPAERLNQTDAAQAAIFVTGMACWHGLVAARGEGPGESPLAATAGLSLGEYTALCLAGALSFEDGLELVLLRGRAMQDAAEASPGGMLALIGADEHQAQHVCDRARGHDVLVCANFNAPGQVVLSGHKVACDRAIGVAGELGLRATALVVAGAFHSPLMQPAADRLATALAKVQIHPMRCPVYSNVTAEPHHGAEMIRARLVEQLTSPVKWSHSCQALATRYAEHHAGHGHLSAASHELAPGKTLTVLYRRIDKHVKVLGHDTPGE